MRALKGTGKIHMRRMILTVLIVCLSVAALAGCGGEESAKTAMETEPLAVSEMFTDRDLSGEYKETEAVEITLSQGDVTICEEGVYHISGSLTDGMICVDADKTAKVQLVLDGVQISNSANAAIYVKEADKVFITLAEGSENSLTSSGYSALDGNNIDGVIFAKSDLTVNGTGGLFVNAVQGHAVVSKDDLKITGGKITITAERKGLAGKDSVRVAGGTLQITSGTDGIHAGEEDADLGTEKGYVYIDGGAFYITAGDDGIHGDGDVRIAGGDIEISDSVEGIEGCNVEISGGNIRLCATDDGVNAAGDGTDHIIQITGGTTYVHAGGDGLDSNGSLAISGGEVYVSGSESGADGALDYETTAQITGGSVIAVGNRAMAMNFGSASTQGSILVTTSDHGAGTSVTLRNSGGEELLSYSTQGAFNSVVVSCPKLVLRDVYTITVGEESLEVELNDELICGTGFENGGFGGGMPGREHPGDDFPGGERPDMPEGGRPEGGIPGGERPDIPEGDFPGGEHPPVIN